MNDYITLVDRGKPLSEEYRPLLVKYVENGDLVIDPPGPAEIREYVMEQLKEVSEPTPVS